MKRLLIGLLAPLAALVPVLASAQLPKPEKVVQVRAEPARLTLAAGATGSATVVAVIDPEFHVNSNKPTLEYLIPTRVELAPADEPSEAPPFELVGAKYPDGELKSFGFAPEDLLSVYEGTLKVPIRLRAQPGAKAGSSYTLRLNFHYQACNDRLCLRPAQKMVTLQVKVQ